MAAAATRACQATRVIRFCICVWCSKVMSATMSLVGVRNCAGSTRPKSVATFGRTARTSAAGSAGLGATALARVGGSPRRAVTYHPPQRSANGLVWSVMMADSSRSGAPVGPGITEPT